MSAQQYTHENKVSYYTDYVVLDLIDFFGDDWKETRKQIEKRTGYSCEKYCID